MSTSFPDGLIWITDNYRFICFFLNCSKIRLIFKKKAANCQIETYSERVQSICLCSYVYLHLNRDRTSFSTYISQLSAPLLLLAGSCRVPGKPGSGAYVAAAGNTGWRLVSTLRLKMYILQHGCMKASIYGQICWWIGTEFEADDGRYLWFWRQTTNTINVKLPLFDTV